MFNLIAAAIAVQLVPPAEFDYPYAGHLFVAVMDAPNVWRECRSLLGRNVAQKTAGCALETGGECFVIVAARSPRASASEILRHEIAHCNGWSHD